MSGLVQGVGAIGAPPSHYSAKGIEPFDIVDAFDLDFFEGNALKYLLRHKKKGTSLADLQKARHYIDEVINRNHGVKPVDEPTSDKTVFVTAVTTEPIKPEFQSFGKIPRWNRNIVITEKIDGTNAAVGVLPDGTVYAQSRKRIVTPESDNFGFAAWVRDNAEELSWLGPGLHFGEWWGSGIQRGYGLQNGEKRFSLFNTARWGDDTDKSPRPPCCEVVPVLGIWGKPDSQFIEDTLQELRTCGSQASPGFMDPEGIIVYHTAGNDIYKIMLENDEGHKGDGA